MAEYNWLVMSNRTKHVLEVDTALPSQLIQREINLNLEATTQGGATVLKPIKIVMGCFDEL